MTNEKRPEGRSPRRPGQAVRHNYTTGAMVLARRGGIATTACTCDLRQAVGILDEIASHALEGDLDYLRILPAAIEHFLSIQSRVRERRR